MHAFEQLPDAARLWIYQSSRKLTPAEVRAITDAMQAFVNQWGAHGVRLKAAAKVVHDRFVMLAVDEEPQAASGCSIDNSVQMMKALEQQFSLGLLERTAVAFWMNDEVVVLEQHELSPKLGEGYWNGDTLVFNNTITTNKELKTRWLVPARSTWLKRYLRTVSA